MPFAATMAAALIVAFPAMPAFRHMLFSRLFSPRHALMLPDAVTLRRLLMPLMPPYAPPRIRVISSRRLR